MKLNKNDRILFIGDSVTDADRDKSNPDSLGVGYAMMVSGSLYYQLPEFNLKTINRGVNGDKVTQVEDRFVDDIFRVKPNVVSILIGVNDFWWTLEGNYNSTAKIYKKEYNRLIERITYHYPDVELIIGEPFALKTGVVDERWYPAFQEYQQTAKDIAKEWGAIFVPYQKAFDYVTVDGKENYWAADGVHPTLAGAVLMADTWLKAVGA